MKRQLSDPDDERIKAALLHLADLWHEFAYRLPDGSAGSVMEAEYRQCANTLRFLLNELEDLEIDAPSAVYNALAQAIDIEDGRIRWEANQRELGEWDDNELGTYRQVN